MVREDFRGVPIGCGFTLNRINLITYITDLLTRLVNGWPQERIDELTPWHWVAAKPN
jgi:hypothetical protein